MLIDGRKIRDELVGKLKNDFTSIGGAVLAVVWVGDDPASEKFIAQKKRLAEIVGVDLRLFEYEENIAQADLEEVVLRLANDSEIDGIIVQLPLPKKIDIQKIIDLIPPSKDVDVLGNGSSFLSPVVSAIKEIFEYYQIDFLNKKILIAGHGKLVGRPVALWLVGLGADVSVFDEETKNIRQILSTADILISGIGKPGLITPDLVKDGVILIDAGTSEQGGRLAGDIDPACYDKASLYTPVPGGVGPIVLTMLFKNLWKISRSTKG